MADDERCVYVEYFTGAQNTVFLTSQGKASSLYALQWHWS